MANLNNRCRSPVVLCVLDGWGYREEHSDNAIVPSNTPAFRALMRSNPHALLKASGTDVGLPEGLMGNSEVGHLNLGAGRVVNQDIRRIDASIREGNLGNNLAFTRFIADLTRSGGRCHLMGLLSPGGVHSRQEHIVALARILDLHGIPVLLHGFLDGRDTPPKSAAEHVADLLAKISHLGRTRLATLCGRFYAMDRDQRWERVKRAHDLLLDGTGTEMDDALAAIQISYASGKTDEFVEPAAISGYPGMHDGDGLLMANFRADRAREIVSALAAPRFDGFVRTRRARFSAVLGMTEYSTVHNTFMNTIFPPEPLQRILGEVIADAGKSQLRIAETEKYAHVTFFFNGGSETPFEREDRVLIPSPEVATYDEQPEMSANEVTDRLISEIEADRHDFVLVNYANPDMVGHTGIQSAAEAAIRTVDDCVGRLARAVRVQGGRLLITADHGNAEVMRNAETGDPHTAHTTNPVPILLVNPPDGVAGVSNGRLADVAPTVLDLMGLAAPKDMTGKSLLTGGLPTSSGSKERAAV